MPPRSAWCWQSSRPCDYLPATPPWAGQGASRGLANWWLWVRPTSSRIGCVRAEWKFCASSTPPGSGRQICEAEFKRCATPRGMPKSAKLLCLAHEAPIDLCINNAIEWPSGGNAYAPTEGQCRYARGPSPASFDIVGQGLVIERSGASHPVRRQLGSAMAPRTPSRGPRRFARALLAGTPVEIGRAPAAPLGEAAGQGGASARLPDAVVDHGTNRRTHPEGIRSALPSRSCRSADA